MTLFAREILFVSMSFHVDFPMAVTEETLAAEIAEIIANSGVHLEMG